MKNQPLLSTYDLNGLTLKNRTVMAPLTRCRADNEHQKPVDKHVEYYTQRTGAGLIITEGSEVSLNARGYPCVAGIFNDQQIEGWKRVTTSVHESDGKIFMQLWHTGRMSLPSYHDGNKPWAPSAVNPDTEMHGPDGKKEMTVTPHAMTEEEIQQTVEEFGQAAKNAKEAGFDGVEIHSSNGYIIHQFFNENSNQRTDKYGGSEENRARFFFEVLESVKKHWPENRIGCRFNPSLHNIFGIEATPDSNAFFEYLFKRLSDYDLSYIHLSEPFNDVSNVDYLVKNIADHYRKFYDGTLMINGGFDQEKGNQVIEKGNADLVAYGKLYLSNPDLAKRFEHHADLNDWDENTFYTQGREGYTDYPFMDEK